MGTRNITMVISEGKIKVAQYGQWDGYPSGQGIRALSFIRSCDAAKFKRSIDKCVFLSSEDIKLLWNEFEPDDEGYVTYENSKKFSSKYQQLHRDAGSEVLNLIYDGAYQLKDDQLFAADGLFCEWGYVIDLDKNTFEVYEGCSKDPLSEQDRFFHMQNGNDEYAPIKMVRSFDLCNLPTESEFLEIMEPK